MRFLLALILFAQTGFADCPPSRPVVQWKPKEMSALLCKAANQPVWQPSADSIAGNCGVGARDALINFAKGFMNMAVEAGQLSKSAWTAALKKVQDLWTNSDDPARASEAAARANAEVNRGWMDTVRDYAKASRDLTAEFIKEFASYVVVDGSTVYCLPWKQKMEYICAFFSQVALELITLKSVLNAADRALAIHKAVRAFMNTTDVVEGLKNLSFAQRLNAVSTLAKERFAMKTVERFGDKGNLKKGIDPITQQETLHLEEFAVVDGKKVSVIRDVFKDAKTLAIDSNEVSGKKAAEMMVANSKDEMLLFGDLGNLGKVNYFKAGTAAGDTYLQHVGEAIRASLRPEDGFFKNGGDELVVILKTKDPAQAKAFVGRVYEAIRKDKTLQDLFKQERIAVRDKILAANTKPAKGFELVDPPTAEQIKELQETAKIRPNISFGATKITGDWAKDLARADKQATLVKAQYKRDIGLETDKYKVDENRFQVIEMGKPNFKAEPKILDPVMDSN